MNDTSHRATVLLVEDDFLVRMNTSACLSDCGYRVIEAANADEAVGVLKDKEVDLIFSDIRMPGSMDGIGLADWVRRHRPHIPVILTSGYWDVADRARELLDGQEPLAKPYTMSDLQKRFAEALSHI